MKNKLLILAGVAVLIAFSISPAKAYFYDFSYVGSGITVSGTLTTSDTLNNNIGGFGLSGYEVVGITGTRNGDPITGLVSNPKFPNPNTVDIAEYDNGLIITSPLGVDYWGILFNVGLNQYNLFSNTTTGAPYEEFLNGYGSTVTEVSLTITQVPQVPDGGMTVSLLGFALGACGLFARKMRKLA